MEKRCQNCGSRTIAIDADGLDGMGGGNWHMAIQQSAMGGGWGWEADGGRHVCRMNAVLM